MSRARRDPDEAAAVSSQDTGAPGGAELRSGTVALFGWTNVGKSTLLNRLVGEHIAAVADVVQTTRRRIVGVLHLPERGQLVFVDTPGLHRPRYAMNRAMIEVAEHALHGVDVVALVLDAARGPGPGDRQAADLLRSASVARLAVLNKIDEVRPRTRLLPMLQEVVEEWGLPEAVPLSARTGENCERLVARLLELVPAAPPLYPADQYTDETERALAAEWIREELLHTVRQELPHATAVLLERWHEGEGGLLELDATILVERESQKPIVIGRGGARLKQIGSAARAELEQLLERHIMLRLWVRVRPDWRNDERTLHELGLR